MNAPISDLSVTVTARHDIGDIAVLELTSNAPLPPWTPGAHVDVLLPSGLVRQYSLCGRTDEVWRIAVLRESTSRGGSSWIHDAIRPGASLELAGPRNHFEFVPTTGPVLLLAGGIGVTPILPMAAAAAAAGADLSVHYAGHAGRMPFIDELTELCADRLTLHVSGDGERMDLTELLGSAAPGTAVYACGPLRLIDEAEKIATGLGLEFHAERFEAEPLAAPVWEGDFEVELAMSAITLTVPPGRSILEVAEENGVFVVSSCQEGTCGTCETPVLDGRIDHRDSILTPAERERGDTMYICVSRAACPKITLDL